MTTDRHARFMALLLGTASACAVLSTPALAQERQRFDIRAQDAAGALNEYARQAGVQIVFPYDRVRGRMTPDVQGDLTRQEALALLTDGMGLTVTSDTAGMVTLRDNTAPQSESAAGDGADGTVEALIVTAQKREEDIQDVPIAISAFTQEDLTRSQVAGGPDLITQVPNMTFTKTNFSSYSVQLRGIGTQAISATTDPAVAVAFNNTPFIRNRFFEQEFYDLQRVEVLRGPQGTLYGRNATAGVVNIISQKPKFVAESKLSGDLSNYNSSRIEGMVNIPLVEDKVALRLAGAWTKRDGYATNQLTGNPIDGRDLWSTRASLRLAPNDRLDINLIWEHFEEEDDRLRSGKQLCDKHVVTQVGPVVIAPGNVGGSLDGWSGIQGMLSQGCERNSLYSPDSFQTPNGNMIPYYLPLGGVGLKTAFDDPYESTVQSRDLRVIESALDPIYRADTDIGELQISFDLTDSLTLSSETAYGTDSVYSFQDFNRFNTRAGAWGGPSNGLPDTIARGVLRTDLGPNLVFCDPQLGCSDRLVAVDLSTATGTQFSQEFRLASDFEGAFNFSLGANFLRADSEDKYYVFINSVSMIAADALYAEQGLYVPGVTDNIDCMLNGYSQGDPLGAYPVSQCTYLDPNLLESVNDEGHNYFLSKNPYKLISYAVFGEAYYQVTDALKVTAGLRWTVDKKEAPRVPTWIVVSQSVGYPVAEVIEQEWREPTGRVTIDWKPDLAFTDETMVYASYAHGYKAGGANPPGFVRIHYSSQDLARLNALDSETRPRIFDPEFVDAFELGAKNTLADGAMTLNLAGFYYDYKDYQISEIVDRSAFNRNFDATVWGIELEADWRPLENLRLGVKGGYQEAEIADGESAVDLMDRTAGDPNWVLMRPFPTYASSCILPVDAFLDGAQTTVYLPGQIGGGNPGGCEIAYIQGLDPVTVLPYVPFPTVCGENCTLLPRLPGYPGFDPATAPNNGEGISKQIGGNELPNAPNVTATITADYTIPLPNEWLATLHTDLHWQGPSDWRIFQDHEYSQLDEYFTMNLAAIFTNEEAGWKVMAYVKNVTDETAITGAFLNSDDTGLTTNVFLTEPRLYGLRVTKEWAGGAFGLPFDMSREGPYPFTVELSGQMQRHDAPNGVLAPSFADEFAAPLDLNDDAQSDDLDWGDGREVKLTWRPNAGPMFVSAGARFGKTNGQSSRHVEEAVGGYCIFAGDYAFLCGYYYAQDPFYFGPLLYPTVDNHVDARAYDREEHNLIDFAVGRDFGFGGLSRSSVSAGVRYARFESHTDTLLRGVPNWVLVEGSYLPGVPITHTTYRADIHAAREFEGWGPTLTWDAALPILDLGEGGKVDLDWSLSAGALFGDRETTATGSEDQMDYLTSPIQMAGFSASPGPISTGEAEITVMPRSSSATVPTAGASIGFGYSAGGFKASAGYRWERYFDVLDAGFMEEQEADRTIDGPYFKLSVGFGG